jgi:hypothetical protein
MRNNNKNLLAKCGGCAESSHTLGMSPSLADEVVMESKEKGILVTFYRSAGGHDCTIGGVSSKYVRATLIGDDIPELLSPTEDCPALYINSTGMKNKYGEPDIFVSPDDENKDAIWCFGGNFIYSSDSRFPRNHPIRVHDRNEGKLNIK